MYELQTLIQEYIKKTKFFQNIPTMKGLIDFLRNGVFARTYQHCLQEELYPHYQELKKTYHFEKPYNRWLEERIMERTKHDFGLVYNQEHEFNIWLLESVRYSIDQMILHENPIIIHLIQEESPKKIEV